MYGNNFTRSFRGMYYMIKRPRDAARWLHGIIEKKSAIDLGVPWFSWPAIDYLADATKPGLRVFEWGGGGSTVFFARLECEVTTVESNQFWKEKIEQRLSELRFASATLRFIPAETGHEAAVMQYIMAVHEGKPWDVIVVDGLEERYLGRMMCLKEVPACLKPGGCVILDDSWRKEYALAPVLLEGWERRTYCGLGPDRPGVTTTDIYFRPR